jgi:hypothetical protein
MREWLDVDSRLFPQQERRHTAPPPLQIVAENPLPKTATKEQLEKLRLREYMDKGEKILSDCRADLAPAGSNAVGSGRLKPIADKLGSFCLDSDSWGFDEIYQIVAQLQRVALEILQGLRAWDARTAQLTASGLDLLQRLLRECERDYDRRIAVANYLQSFAPDVV